MRDEELLIFATARRGTKLLAGAERRRAGSTPITVSIAMHELAPISGHVSAADGGRPRAGVKVWGSPMFIPPPSLDDAGFPLIPAERPFPRRPLLEPVLTDDAGHFTFATSVTCPVVLHVGDGLGVAVRALPGDPPVQLRE